MSPFPCPLSRRILLQSTAAVAALSFANEVHADPAKDLSIVDTHTHFYDPERKEGVPWPGKDDKVLYRPVLPAEFEKLTQPLGVLGTIVVEASPWVEDNQWLLDLAQENKSILGVIGNLKPGTDRFANDLKRFCQSQLFCGFRINTGAVVEGISDGQFLNHMFAVHQADRIVEVNGGPETPGEVAALNKALRPMNRPRFCINHCGNLKIDGGPPPAKWLEGMKAAAEYPNVYCKVSALVESTGKREGDAPRNVDFYRPVLDALWSIWGSDRLLYGSNWPVSTRAASYETVLDIVRQYLANRPAKDQERFFSTNCKSAYGIWRKR
ncbi:amidohydrolase family protein [Anatilimnocola floriformis]|uniref:amidohydrolase family protein n=1 Tax=Anatilimnocola floriformis TaxID=2948575 RepID=UPI0020C4E29A|nr:amidohydrolase family protein [Anatilimnocola floriformis]